MNSLQLVSKIRTKADDLSANIQQILSLGTSFNALEKELLKKQCTDLYELILKLKTEQEQTEQHSYVTTTTPSTPPIINPPSPAPPPEPIVKNWVEPTPAEEYKEMAKLVNEDITLDELEAKLQAPIVETSFPEINVEKAVENKRIQKTVMPSIEEPKTLPLNNVFKDREATYNDKNVNETISPIVEKTLEAPLDSIKTAITLNKKIAFVNELFKENVVEYAKSIDRLNQAIDLNDALRMFSEMKHTYNWDNANELVQDLDRLIKRRYA
jgi:hypothetical protein